MDTWQFLFINTDMKDKNGMTYEELLDELKSMRAQIVRHKSVTRELHRLDAEYWHIMKMEKKGALPDIEIVNADTRNTRKG